MTQIRKTTETVVDLFELVAKSMLLIFVIAFIAKALLEAAVSEGLANVGAVIVGLGIAFIIATNQQVRSELKNFGGRKKWRGR